jgi:hypothetical protein
MHNEKKMNKALRTSVSYLRRLVPTGDGETRTVSQQDAEKALPIQDLHLWPTDQCMRNPVGGAHYFDLCSPSRIAPSEAANFTALSAERALEWKITELGKSLAAHLNPAN